MFDEFEQRRRFQEAWEKVEIARPVRYSLFTFGESVLEYYLVCGKRGAGTPVTVTRGEVRIKRPTIITPDNAGPEFEGFFEDDEEEGVVRCVLARAAQFSNFKFDNRRGEAQTVSESMDEAVSRLNRQLDNEDEDRVAILTAPPQLGGVAVLRYAAERVAESGPDNIQELRERGFLP